MSELVLIMSSHFPQLPGAVFRQTVAVWSWPPRQHCASTYPESCLLSVWTRLHPCLGRLLVFTIQLWAVVLLRRMPKIYSAKISVVIMLLLRFFLTSAGINGWRRHSYCRCSARDCKIIDWSSWSYCNADRCGERGYQSRSKTIVSRQRYGSSSVACELSHWSEWSGCTTPCGVSGTQSSFRHRTTIEQCGGTACSSSFRKTRSCRPTGCFNEGSL